MTVIQRWPATPYKRLPERSSGHQRVTYATLAGFDGFDRQKDVATFLAETGINTESPTQAALTTAGDAFNTCLT